MGYIPIRCSATAKFGLATHFLELGFALAGWVVGLVGLLDEGLDVDFFFILLQILYNILKLTHLILQLRIFFFLHNELADEELSVILLRLKICKKFCILFD